MIRTSNNDNFRTILDRNGAKIHIGEQVLFKNFNQYKEGVVVAFSDTFKYVYVICCDVLFKRTGQNLVIVHNLRNWKHTY